MRVFKGRWIQTIVLMLLATVLGLVSIGQSAELGDFLPEVQLARSVFLSLDLIDDLESAGASDNCDANLTADDLPGNLWVADSGKLRAEAKVLAILRDSACVLALAFGSAEAFFNALAENNTVLFEIASGQIAEVSPADSVTQAAASSNGVLDGGKQPLRHAVVFPLAISLQIELSFGVGFDIPTPVLGDDQCAALRDMVFNGSTLEVRWAAFLTLFSDYYSGRSNLENVICTEAVSIATETELLTAARRNDLNAALELAAVWNDEAETVARAGEPFAALKTLEDEIFLRFTVHYGEPLVTLAATIAFITLKVEMQNN